MDQELKHVAGRAIGVDTANEELSVLPAGHLQQNLSLVLESGEAQVTEVFDPDPNALPKRRRGRPAGKSMRLIAESLRHHHFSFLRANVEGVRDLRWIWERYLGFEGGPDDERHFQLRLRELVHLVSVTAAERGLARRAEVAFSGLDLRPPAPPRPPAASSSAAMTPPPGAGAAPASPPAPALPTLDEWREEQCDARGWSHDDFRQAEWLEMLEEEFGLDQPVPVQPATALVDTPNAPPPSPLSREGSPSNGGSATAAGNASHLAPAPIGTVEERVENLNVLAFELSKPPTLLDPLGTWLMPELARRLAGASIKGNPMPLVTMSNLIDFVNLFGHRWWVHVPRLGVQRAQRLMIWLVPQAEELGKPIKEGSRVPHGQRMQAQQVARSNAVARFGADGSRRFGLVTLDRLAVPAELDGRVATFRSKVANTLGVETDLQAIYAWLQRRSDKVRTVEQYGRMLERFYLWCLWVKKKAIGDLVEGDFHDYKAFLRKPPADWVNDRQVSRSSPDWRPLRGPQNENSLRQNFTVINAFLNALHKAGYLTAQAGEGVMPGLRLKQMRMNIDRSFDDAQWTWLIECWERRYEAVGPSFGPGEAQPMIPDGNHPDQNPGKAMLLRRQRLVLELGATTGMRLIELVTTRRRSISRALVDGTAVWLARVIGKGEKVREVLIRDDVKALIDQHHADMDMARTSFDLASSRVRSVSNPDGVASAREPDAQVLDPDYAPEPDSGLVQLPSPPPLLAPAPVDSSFDEGMRPLVGALRRPIKPAGLPADGGELGTSDKYGSLDPSGLRQSLKRFLGSCADEAVVACAAIDVEKLRAASTHWLRHFFANSAASDGVSPVALMESLGHSSLATTTVYLRPERKRLVEEMAKLRRR